MSITSGFGAGMGRLQKTCGAVTGAFMVLSYFSSQKNKENAEAKEEAIVKIKEFNTRFLEKNHATDCKTLLNCDLNSEQGQEDFKINNLRESVCEKCIRDSILITSELLTQR
jgi:C_GCAxxG_C_C family probable redox protein